MRVEKGEVGRHDDLLGANPDVICYSRGAYQLPRLGVLIDVQALCNAGDEFQRVELCLLRGSDRTDNGKGKRSLSTNSAGKPSFSRHSVPTRFCGGRPENRRMPAFLQSCSQYSGTGPGRLGVLPYWR